MNNPEFLPIELQQEFSFLGGVPPIFGTTDITNPLLYGPGGHLDGTIISISLVDVSTFVPLMFNGANTSLNMANMLAAIDAAYPGLVATLGPENQLVLTKTTVDGYVTLLDTTANPFLGLLAPTASELSAIPPASGILTFRAFQQFENPLYPGWR
jgi:hypothetical protein